MYVCRYVHPSLFPEFDCTNFPGPGVTNPMGENPFFEFVGSEGYSDEDKTRKMEGDFKHFKNKHGKKYEDDKEEAMRKTHFRHNYRSVTRSLSTALCNSSITLGCLVDV